VNSWKAIPCSKISEGEWDLTSPYTSDLFVYRSLPPHCGLHSKSLCRLRDWQHSDLNSQPEKQSVRHGLALLPLLLKKDGKVSGF
jgi:hypothetical protein